MTTNTPCLFYLITTISLCVKYKYCKSWVISFVFGCKRVSSRFTLSRVNELYIPSFPSTPIGCLTIKRQEKSQLFQGMGELVAYSHYFHNYRCSDTGCCHMMRAGRKSSVLCRKVQNLWGSRKEHIALALHG